MSSALCALAQSSPSAQKPRKLNYAEFRAVAIDTPMPARPDWNSLPLALRRRVNGASAGSIHYSGTFALQIDANTGEVTSVKTVTSTGVDALDRAAIHALQQWRIKPHTFSGGVVPIDFAFP